MSVVIEAPTQAPPAPREVAEAWVQEHTGRSTLPRGLPRNPANCVLARAFGRGASVGSRVSINEELSLTIPRAVLEFVSEFDRGRHPDLEMGVLEAHARHLHDLLKRKD